MTLGRTAEGKIKIKTDGGLRSVECACCMSLCGGCTPLKQILGGATSFNVQIFDDLNYTMGTPGMEQFCDFDPFDAVIEITDTPGFTQSGVFEFQTCNSGTAYQRGDCGIDSQVSINFSSQKNEDGECVIRVCVFSYTTRDSWPTDEFAHYYWDACFDVAPNQLIGTHEFNITASWDYSWIELVCPEDEDCYEHRHRERGKVTATRKIIVL